jgi:hypothetical protein
MDDLFDVFEDGLQRNAAPKKSKKRQANGDVKSPVEDAHMSDAPAEAPEPVQESSNESDTAKVLKRQRRDESQSPLLQTTSRQSSRARSLPLQGFRRHRTDKLLYSHIRFAIRLLYHPTTTMCPFPNTSRHRSLRAHGLSPWILSSRSLSRRYKETRVSWCPRILQQAKRSWQSTPLRNA